MAAAWGGVGVEAAVVAGAVLTVELTGEGRVDGVEAGATGLVVGLGLEAVAAGEGLAGEGLAGEGLAGASWDGGVDFEDLDPILWFLWSGWNSSRSTRMLVDAMDDRQAFERK